MGDEQSIDRLTMTAEIVSAYVGHNSVSATEVPNLIAAIYSALDRLSGTDGVKEAPAKPQGAVTARKSLANEKHIISMIDGQPYTMLTRHIKRHGYTPKTYREEFGLAADYPMTAPAYSERRSALAKAIGLGRKKPVAEAPAPTPKRRRLSIKTD